MDNVDVYCQDVVGIFHNDKVQCDTALLNYFTYDISAEVPKTMLKSHS